MGSPATPASSARPPAVRTSRRLLCFRADLLGLPGALRRVGSSVGAGLVPPIPMRAWGRAQGPGWVRHFQRGLVKEGHAITSQVTWPPAPWLGLLVAHEPPANFTVLPHIGCPHPRTISLGLNLHLLELRKHSFIHSFTQGPRLENDPGSRSPGPTRPWGTQTPTPSCLCRSPAMCTCLPPTTLQEMSS